MNASRTRLLFTLSALFALSRLASDAQAATTKVQFTSHSVLVSPAVTQDPITDVDVTLTLTSVGNQDAPNWELATFTSDHGFSHESFFLMEDEIFGPILFDFVLDIPPYDDVNANGIDDFYDIDVSVDGIETIGLHLNDQGEAEEFTALWYRDAGATVGIVVIDLPYFQMTFEHFHELVQFNGEYTYTKSGSQLQGNLALTNAVNLEDRITGPLSVTIVDNNTLQLNATTWSSTMRNSLEIADNVYDGRFKTNFISYWLFEDGYAGTTVPDYLDWTMVLISEDANGNGVMDLVEGGGEPQSSSLAIRKTANGFEITLTGTPATTYWIEYTSDLTATSWPNHHVVSTPPGSNSATVTLPEDAVGDVFFRSRVAP